MYVGTPQVIGKESLNIKGALSRCLLHYVNKVNYVSLFTMELEKLLFLSLPPFFVFAVYFMPSFRVLNSLNLLLPLIWLVFIMIIFVTRLL